jgi:hypothetical protein
MRGRAMQDDKSFQEALRELKKEILAGTPGKEMEEKFASYILLLTPTMLKPLNNGETIPSIAAQYADNEQEQKTLVDVFRSFLFRGLLEINLKQGIIQKPLYDELLAFVRDLLP